MEINLENPIFVYYFDVTGSTKQRTVEHYEALSQRMSQYTNITFWIVPADYNKMYSTDGNQIYTL